MWWTVAAGVCCALAWLVFADGAVEARRVSLPYNFAMYAPAILALCGTFVSLFVDVAALARHTRGRDGDDYDDDDDGTPCGAMQRNKALFFAAAVLLFGALAVAVWKMTDPYMNANNSNNASDIAWPGVALLVHTLLLIACDVLLLTSKAQRHAGRDGDDSFAL